MQQNANFCLCIKHLRACRSSELGGVNAGPIRKKLHF